MPQIIYNITQNKIFSRKSFINKNVKIYIVDYIQLKYIVEFE